MWDFAGAQPRPLTWPEAYGSLQALSPDGRTVVAWHGDECLLAEVSGEVRQLLSGKYEADEMQFSPDGHTVAVYGGRGIRLWPVDAAPGGMTQLRTRSRLRSLAFTPDGRTLATGEIDGSVVLWNLATAQDLLTLHQYPGIVWSLAFTPDSRGLVVSAFDPPQTVVDRWLAADGADVGGAAPGSE
jgi:WD40 repeat protein